MLCRKKDEGPNGELYAMKTLKKQVLVQRNQLVNTKTERNILQNIQHPFLVNLRFAFQTSDKLYMVLEYVGGGELFHWLKQHRKFSESRGNVIFQPFFVSSLFFFFLCPFINYSLVSQLYLPHFLMRAS
jgi:serine/threonine protein kinase